MENHKLEIIVKDHNGKTIHQAVVHTAVISFSESKNKDALNVKNILLGKPEDVLGVVNQIVSIMGMNGAKAYAVQDQPMPVLKFPPTKTGDIVC